MDYDKLREMSKRLTEYLDSPKGQEELSEWYNRMEKEKTFNSRWVERIRTFFKDSENKCSLIQSLIDHDKKISDQLFYKGIDGQSNLASFAFEALKPFGEELPIEKQSMFTSDSFMLYGYSFEVLNGQGVFISINKL